MLVYLCAIFDQPHALHTGVTFREDREGVNGLHQSSHQWATGKPWRISFVGKCFSPVTMESWFIHISWCIWGV